MPREGTVVLICSKCSQAFKVMDLKEVNEARYGIFTIQPNPPHTEANMFPFLTKANKVAMLYCPTATNFAFDENPECPCMLIWRLAHC